MPLTEPASSVPVSRKRWAVVAVAGTVLFATTMVALHLVQPNYNPVHQLMSELVFGRFGQILIVAFLGLALAAFGIQAATAQVEASGMLRSLLIAAAILFLAAGVYPLGKSTEIHIIVVAAAFTLSVVAMYLFPSAAGRASAAAPRFLSWPLAAGAIASVSLLHVGVPIGVGQRLAAGCMLTWMAIVGWRLRRL